MTNPISPELQHAVVEKYGRVATSTDTTNAWCGAAGASADSLAQAVGYRADELAALPTGANMGLGSGNPLARARLQPGEAVLDLGSGGGADCFLAARAVGPSGRVVGVDVTPEMIDKARALAAEQGLTQVSFVQAAIEALPLPDAQFDVVLSNCVFNLSADRAQAFKEALRVLKPGGRLVMSDLVALVAMPAALKQSVEHHVGCMGGAALMSDLEAMLRASGFGQIRITPRPESAAFIRRLAPHTALADHLTAAYIEAVRPPAI